MQEKLLTLLERICGTNEIRENADLNLFEAGLLDSLGVIELLVGIEEQLGIRIEPTEVERQDIETVNKILSYLSQR